MSQPETHHEFVEKENGLPSRDILLTLKPATGILTTGKERTCCGPHKTKGCFDQFVMDCVCAHDKFCCEQEF